MAGSRIPIVVSHGEGRTRFAPQDGAQAMRRERLITLRYVDNNGAVTMKYPLNPNGSEDGITGLTTPDGRVTIMMPHPERVFRAVQLSYCPPGCADDVSPWFKMFENARRFVG